MVNYRMANLVALDSQNTIEGDKGSGKTTLAMMYWAEYLRLGKEVFLNFDLYGWWPDFIARLKFGASYGKKSPEQLREYYKDVMNRCFRFDDWDDLYDLRPVRLKDKSPEGQRLVIFDEGTQRMNSRTWTERKQADKSRYNSPIRQTAFFSQARKLGYHLVVIAQAGKDLDSQWRSQKGYRITSKNLNKEGYLGFRFPFTMFRTNVYCGTGKVGGMFWGYPKYLAPFYDSWEYFDEMVSQGLRFQYDPLSPLSAQRQKLSDLKIVNSLSPAEVARATQERARPLPVEEATG